MQKRFLSPPEIAEYFVELGRKKAEYSIVKQLLLGIMAGAFIALACQGANQAVHIIGYDGVGKLVAGALFACGLMLVLIAGGELFTGNCLMIIACFEKKIKVRSMLRSWLFVYAGNFIGALLVTVMIIASGQLNFSNGALGAFTIYVAAYKTEMNFMNAFFMGVLCNLVVCLAVWAAASALDTAGKILAVFFPIWLFVTSGFEHSIANMYYIPAGILAKANGYWASGLGADVSGLTWPAFFIANLIPVTLGNTVGGVFLVGAAYWFIYLKRKK